MATGLSHVFPPFCFPNTSDGAGFRRFFNMFLYQKETVADRYPEAFLFSVSFDCGIERVGGLFSCGNSHAIHEHMPAYLSSQWALPRRMVQLGWTDTDSLQLRVSIRVRR